MDKEKFLNHLFSISKDLEEISESEYSDFCFWEYNILQDVCTKNDDFIEKTFNMTNEEFWNLRDKYFKEHKND